MRIRKKIMRIRSPALKLEIPVTRLLCTTGTFVGEMLLVLLLLLLLLLLCGLIAVVLAAGGAAARLLLRGQRGLVRTLGSTRLKHKQIIKITTMLTTFQLLRVPVLRLFNTVVFLVLALHINGLFDLV